MNIPSIVFNGLKVSIFSIKDLNNYFNYCIDNKNTIICYGYSFGIFPQIKEYPEIYLNSNKFDLMVTDGRLFYLFLKLFGVKLKSDLSIPRLVLFSLNYANDNNLKIFLLGGKKHVNKKAVKNISMIYPNIKLIDGHDGYWKKKDDAKIIQIIKDYDPHILYIMLPSPQKEVLATKLKKLEIATIIIPSGGMIDVLSGEIKLTPTFIKKIGFAWLYRLLQQPSRFRLTIQFWKALITINYMLLLNAIFKQNKNVFIEYFKIDNEIVSVD